MSTFENAHKNYLITSNGSNHRESENISLKTQANLAKIAIFLFLRRSTKLCTQNFNKRCHFTSQQGRNYMDRVSFARILLLPFLLSYLRFWSLYFDVFLSPLITLENQTIPLKNHIHTCIFYVPVQYFSNCR